MFCVFQMFQVSQWEKPLKATNSDRTSCVAGQLVVFENKLIRI